MRHLLVLAFAISVALATPALPKLGLRLEDRGNRITNGENASEGQFPYQASLQWGLLGVYQHVCGASLISPTYALSAGHCVTELPSLGSFRVIAGILNINSAGESRDVDLSLVHPDYEGGVNPFDLSLHRLESAFDPSPSIQIIPLPAAGYEPSGPAVLSGWGSTSTGLLPSYPSILQYVEIPILPYEECEAALADLFGSSEPLHPTNVCTGPLYEAISACSGDSGGPLAQNGELIGVVSWGVSPCGYPGAPSVFVKVSSFIEYLEANVPDLPARAVSH